MKTTLNVLLTGASGTVGTEVLRQLAPKENIKLSVFDVRNARNQKLFAPFRKKVNIIYGDLCNFHDIERIPCGLDAVIHLAAIIPPRADELPVLTRKVNVEGTKSLLEHLETTSPKAFLLYSSSVAVYGDRVENPYIRVGDALVPGDYDVYARSKVEAEQLIRDCRLDWTIFRLAAIMKNHRISRLMFHMPLSTMLEICTPEDTAKAFAEAIFQRQELAGRVFNLGGGGACCIPYEKFLEKSFSLFGLGALSFPTYAFARQNFHCGMMADGDELENILHFRTDTLESYFAKTQGSIPKIKRFFGMLFRDIIKYALLQQSEPYRAVRTNNTDMIKRFFGERDFSFLKYKTKKTPNPIKGALRTHQMSGL